jgi:uncharacterized protein DUF664
VPGHQESPPASDSSVPASPAHPAEPAGRLPERQFGWQDMLADPDSDPREQGGMYHGERETLVRYLRDHRLTLQMKCSGLDAAGMASRSVPPSNMSPLGLVRHLAGVEQFWFRMTMAGQPARARHFRADDPDGDFNGAVADPEVVGDAWACWRAEVEFAEQLVAAAPDLEITGDTRRGDAEPDLITLSRGARAHDRGVRPAQRPR